MNAIANVVRAYHGAVLAAESAKVADEAGAAAEADLSRAQAVREPACPPTPTCFP